MIEISINMEDGEVVVNNEYLCAYDNESGVTLFPTKQDALDIIKALMEVHNIDVSELMEDDLK